MIDSGIALKHDLTNQLGLASRVVYSQNFVRRPGYQRRLRPWDPRRRNIGSNGMDSAGSLFTHTFKGVAPNVNLISLKVLDEQGDGQEADVIAAIQTAIALKNTYNIRVINLSLGRPVSESCRLDPLPRSRGRRGKPRHCRSHCRW